MASLVICLSKINFLHQIGIHRLTESKDLETVTREIISMIKPSAIDSTSIEAKYETQPDNKPLSMAEIFGDSDEEPYMVVQKRKRVKACASQYRKSVQEKQVEPQILAKSQHTDDIEQFLRNKKLARKLQLKVTDADKAKFSFMAIALVEQMLEAARNDRINLEQRKPALEKIKMVKAVKAALLRQNLYLDLIQNNVYTAISEWIDILPDGNLPNVKIRTTILSILEYWDIPSKHDLESSGLAYSLSNLAGHPYEIPSYRSRLSQLLFKWTKPYMRLNTDEERGNPINRQNVSKALDSKNILDPINITSSFAKPNRHAENGDAKPESRETKLRSRAIEPEPDNVNYIIRPPSMVDDYTAVPKYRDQKKITQASSKFVRKMRRRR